MSSFDRPAATRATTSRSRAVSSSRRRGGRASAGANSAIRRRVTPGESRPSPAAMTRTARISSAASVSLTRKPAAPPGARRRCTRPGRRWSGSGRARRPIAGGGDLPRRGDAVEPRHPDVHQDHVRACVPGERDRLEAVRRRPVTVMSSSASRRAAKPERTSSWSSARATRIAAHPGHLGLTITSVTSVIQSPRQPREDPEAAAGTGARVDGAAERPRPLGHAARPLPVGGVRCRRRGVWGARGLRAPAPPRLPAPAPQPSSATSISRSRR